ncbi:MAG: ribosome small subunit-dependent GTPase A [Gammaproteobacteria bacterium]|nr:ribosome small subunit-dependent GTPase A [Gammaproteobacteria bacterium]
MTDGNPDSAGVVVAAFGNRGKLETADGKTLPYLLKGRRLKAVCGDRVHWTQPQQSHEALVTEVLSRDNALQRSDRKGRVETVAANLTQLIVVLAPTPEPDLFLIDRFLCAATLMDCNPLLVCNKADLERDESLQAALDEYRQFGYRVMLTCANPDGEVADLARLLAGQTSMLVGQSGVGKSSLINVLVGDGAAAVGALSDASGKGKHTTSATIMHRLADGARLIDSPGVREFVPIIGTSSEVQLGFPEIVALADQCRFTNCQHQREPDCAVKRACADGGLSPRRYASYKRLKTITSAGSA